MQIYHGSTLRGDTLGGATYAVQPVRHAHNKKISDVRIPAACRNAYLNVPGSYSSRREKVSTPGPPDASLFPMFVLLFRLDTTLGRPIIMAACR